MIIHRYFTFNTSPATWIKVDFNNWYSMWRVRIYSNGIGPVADGSVTVGYVTTGGTVVSYTGNVVNEDGLCASFAGSGDIAIAQVFVNGIVIDFTTMMQVLEVDINYDINDGLYHFNASSNTSLTITP